MGSKSKIKTTPLHIYKRDIKNLQDANEVLSKKCDELLLERNVALREVDEFKSSSSED